LIDRCCGEITHQLSTGTLTLAGCVVQGCVEAACPARPRPVIIGQPCDSRDDLMAWLLRLIYICSNTTCEHCADTQMSIVSDTISCSSVLLHNLNQRVLHCHHSTHLLIITNQLTAVTADLSLC